MVNMSKLPEGTKFAAKGGVGSIGRDTTHKSDPAYSLAAQILRSRGYMGLETNVVYKADPNKNMLSTKVLANNGLELQADGTYRKVSSDRARKVVNNAEMSGVVSQKGISR